MAKKVNFDRNFSLAKRQVVVQQKALTKEQMLIKEVVGGEGRSWGTGENLPKVEGKLMQGGGLIKNGDGGQTRGFFGW